MLTCSFWFRLFPLLLQNSKMKFKRTNFTFLDDIYIYHLPFIDHQSTLSCSLAKNWSVITTWVVFRGLWHLSAVLPDLLITSPPRGQFVQCDCAPKSQNGCLSSYTCFWLNHHQHPASSNRNTTSNYPFQEWHGLQLSKARLFKGISCLGLHNVHPTSIGSPGLDILTGQHEYWKVSMVSGRQWINQKNSWPIKTCITFCQMLPRCWWLTAS